MSRLRPTCSARRRGNAGWPRSARLDPTPEPGGGGRAAGALRPRPPPRRSAQLGSRVDPRGAPRVGGETGCPPRRADWSGERPERAGGAQRKWMAEHPRWPSSSCVAGHSGHGAQPAGRRPPGAQADLRDLGGRAGAGRAAPRGRRAGHARHRAGARGLGVDVGNYLRARDCPDCGGPVTSPRATRCVDCTAREPAVAGAWTRQSVCEAIRDWEAEHGRPPTYREWTPARERPGIWEAESPRWPSAAVVCERYRDRADPWNAALLDAGVTVRFQRWSDDAIRRLSPASGRVLDALPRSPTCATRHGADRARRRCADATAAWRPRGARWARRRPGRCLTRGLGRRAGRRRRRPGLIATVVRLRGIELWIAPAGADAILQVGAAAGTVRPAIRRARACAPASPCSTPSRAWRWSPGASVGDRQHHVGRLDHGRDLRALRDAEVAHRLDGDRGHEPQPVGVELDVGRGPLRR